MFSDADGRSTETGQRSHCPADSLDWLPLSGGDWEGPAADGRQFDWTAPAQK